MGYTWHLIMEDTLVRLSLKRAFGIFIGFGRFSGFDEFDGFSDSTDGLGCL